MTCFNPNYGYETIWTHPSGKRGFTNRRDQARIINNTPVQRITKCRKCEGCRMAYSKEWAVRIMHEASLHKHNSFITLTYNDDMLPDYGALNYDHWTGFIKRLRDTIDPLRIRYYMVGEYGDYNLRPHYHAIIFGFDFPDKVFHKSRFGEHLYRSPLLEKKWSIPEGEPGAGLSYGYSSIGTVTAASAAYVARYSMKKLIGVEFDGREEFYVPETGEVLSRPKVNERYIRYNQETGDRIIVPPEKALMSRRDGIGKKWFDEFGKDVYRTYPNGRIHDCLKTEQGFTVRPPSYYDSLLSKVDEEQLERVKAQRQIAMEKHASEFTPERLAQKRTCLLSKLDQLKRNAKEIYQ